MFLTASNQGDRPVNFTDEGLRIGGIRLACAAQRLRACGQMRLAPKKALHLCFEAGEIATAARDAGGFGHIAFSAFLEDECGRVFLSNELRIDVDSYAFRA